MVGHAAVCGALKELKSGRGARANCLGAQARIGGAPRQFAQAFSMEFNISRRDDLK